MFVNHPRDWDLTRVRLLFEQQRVVNWPGDWDFTEMKAFGSEIAKYGPDFDFSWHLQDPFDPVMHPSYQLPTFPGIDRKTAGAAVMIFGTGMLLPGPFDLVVAAAGAYAGGPAGAVGAVLLYNITAVGLIAVGYLMMTY